MKTAHIKKWASTGTPFIWINAGAVAISLIMVVGLLLILAVNGLSHFWPKDVLRGSYSPRNSEVAVSTTAFIGEVAQTEQVPVEQLRDAGVLLPDSNGLLERQLIKFGNRDITGVDFGWVITEFVTDIEYPKLATVVERRGFGNFYGFLNGLTEAGEVLEFHNPDAEESDSALWSALQSKLDRVALLYDEINLLQRREIAQINYDMERLRLAERRLEQHCELDAQALNEIDSRRAALEAEFGEYQSRLSDFYGQVESDVAYFTAANGQQVEISLGDIIRAYRPNNMSFGQKLKLYFAKIGEFLTSEPREANTEGGIFPAIFGTAVMVLLMSVIVTPFGVVAAVYLREYAKQGLATRIIRIAVNNLAGVPSIVYGVFGLGFFIYIVGGEIDRVFYSEALPAPTFGTPGLLWASLTLALLTVPVVIVATEEGLARIPRSLREGSLALGATKFETIVKVVFPVASPAMITGLILAIARAAGEVAPLMLVGVVKLAPSLPVNGVYPYIHLDQKFMHLGYHIYDVGFQSPNVDAAKPLVFATALLLVLVIALLNLSAATIRNRLREKYKSLDV